MNVLKKKPIIINGNYTTLQKRIVEFSFNKVGECNPYNKSRHVSVLCKGKDILTYGVNNESATYTNRFGYLSNHSEYEVIRRFLRFNTLQDLEKLTLFNCRINRFNEVVNSRPCRRCSYMLQYFSPKNIWYTNQEGGFEQYV